MRIINEQELISAFLAKGCTWTDARMLAMQAKLTLMLSSSSVEEVIDALLTK
jgi:hypothetical protein